MNCFDVVVPWSRAAIVLGKEWGGEEKVDYYARTDKKSKEKIRQDRRMGNLGEAAVRIHMQSYGYDCPELSLDTASRYGEWQDDVKVKCPCVIVTPAGQTVRVEDDISVKSQTQVQAQRYHTSWMIQRQTPDRPGDPLLQQPDAQILIMGVVILSYEPGQNIHTKIYPFFWPDVYKYLKDPALPSLKGKKFVWYLSHMKDLVVPLIKPVYNHVAIV
jgi:hypothetical protein